VTPTCRAILTPYCLAYPDCPCGDGSLVADTLAALPRMAEAFPSFEELKARTLNVALDSVFGSIDPARK
jgi:hypothetical protein